MSVKPLRVRIRDIMPRGVNLAYLRYALALIYAFKSVVSLAVITPYYWAGARALRVSKNRARVSAT